MYLDNLELTIVSEWTEKKKAKKKPVQHRVEIGSVKIDYCVGPEALGKLIDVIHEDVFEYDAVKIEISATSSNY